MSKEELAIAALESVIRHAEDLKKMVKAQAALPDAMMIVEGDGGCQDERQQKNNEL